MGAKKEDLPDIWEKLVDAGFERYFDQALFALQMI